MRVGIRTENGGMIAAHSISEIAVSGTTVVVRTPTGSSVVARPLNKEEWAAIPDTERRAGRGLVTANQLVLELYRAIRECDEAKNPFLFITYTKEQGTWQIFDATEQATKADKHHIYIEASN